MDAITAMNNFNQVLLSAAGMITASNTSSDDRKLVRQQNELSRNWNEKMWHEQNAYNTPSAQIGRLLDAGLNPALAYGALYMFFLHYRMFTINANLLQSY